MAFTAATLGRRRVIGAQIAELLGGDSRRGVRQHPSAAS
jgi:hypothetical protein